MIEGIYTDRWVQVGGDMDPWGHGGAFARDYGNGGIDVLHIENVESYVGKDEAREVGYPFWYSEQYLEVDELCNDAPSDAFISTLSNADWDRGDWRDATPRERLSMLVFARQWIEPSPQGGGWSTDCPRDDLPLIGWAGNVTDGTDEDESFKDWILGDGSNDED